MGYLLDMLPVDNIEEAFNPEYQATMYMIEGAMRDLGLDSKPEFRAGPYDKALEKLIDAVPLEM